MWRDCLHLDDADMQAVSHSRREVSLNRGISGASNKQRDTRSEKGSRCRLEGGGQVCVEGRVDVERGVSRLALQLGPQSGWADEWWLRPSGSYCTGLLGAASAFHPRWWPGERPMGS